MMVISKKSKISLYIGIGFLLSVIFAEAASILILNNGKFVYTLDDPYIHLALAENIATMHYGVNMNEFSAPSSSILWPFLLAPFSSIEIFPLLLNIIFASLTVYVFYRLLCISLIVSDNISNIIMTSLLLILLILSTNLVGLVFTGMEHSLQVLFTSIIAYGLIKESETDKLETWLGLAIVASPLIRYENIAISTAALIYLVMRKHYKNSLMIGILITILVCSFSLFLSSLGLGVLPTSVFAKSNIIGGQFFGSLYDNLKNTLIEHRQGEILSIGTFVMLVYLLLEIPTKKKLLVTSTIFANSAHFLAGRYDWYNRYEIYIWTYFLLIFLYLVTPQIKNILNKENWKSNLAKLSIVMIAFVVVTTPKYIYDLKDLSLASNNIYEQQYQLHRFALIYNKPVAVNDLGYISYKNDNYVLDLVGLASKTALEYYKGNNGSWMQELCSKKNVELAMIYDSWFPGIPDNWIKIGELHLGKERITPADDTVSFYATNQKGYTNIMKKMRIFVKTLPPDVKFTFVENPYTEFK